MAETHPTPSPSPSPAPAPALTPAESRTLRADPFTDPFAGLRPELLGFVEAAGHPRPRRSATDTALYFRWGSAGPTTGWRPAADCWAPAKAALRPRAEPDRQGPARGAPLGD